MSRRTRPYLPGVAFHITARTHRKEPWFDDGMRDEIVRLLGEAVARADARLLAYVVMPNHLHLVVRQGRDPLSRLVQPLLRRIAYRVHRANEFTGYVFERRFRSRTCGDPEYVRNAIVYTHLNPVRAGLCTDTTDYRWSSQTAFCSPATNAEPSSWLRIDDALRLFAPTADAAVAECVEPYRDFVRWRIDADRHRLLCELGTADEPPPTRPRSIGGDAYWLRTFRGDVEAAAEPRKPRSRRDLRDIAQATLVRLAPTLDLESVRGGCGGRLGARLRRAISRSAVAEGYRNRQVAEFLRISESRVSRLTADVARPF